MNVFLTLRRIRSNDIYNYVIVITYKNFYNILLTYTVFEYKNKILKNMLPLFNLITLRDPSIFLIGYIYKYKSGIDIIDEQRRMKINRETMNYGK